MFETIFTAYGVNRHQSAPLLREREAFLAHLQRRVTGRVCLRAYASRLNQIVRFLNLTSLRDVRSSEIKVAAQRWANYRGKHRHLLPGPWSAPSFVWLAKRWLRFHGRLLLPYRKFAFTDELRHYGEFMESERRLSAFTIRSRLYQTERFLRWSSKYRRKRQLCTLTLKDVDGYFAAMAGRWGNLSLSSVAAILRAFFVYAERYQRCSATIAPGIKGPPIRLDSSPPGGPKWNEVLRLICEESTNARGVPVAASAR